MRLVVALLSVIMSAFSAYSAEAGIKTDHTGKITFIDNDGYVILELKPYSEERIFDSAGASLTVVTRAYASAGRKYAAVFRTVYSTRGAPGRFSDIIESDLSLLYDNGELRWKKQNIAPYTEFNLCFARNETRLIVAAIEPGVVPAKVKSIIIFNINGSEAWKSEEFGAPGYMKLSPNGKFASFSYSREAGGAQEQGCVFVDVEKKRINRYLLPPGTGRAVPNVTDQGKCIVTVINPEKVGGFKVKQIEEVLYEFTFSRY